MGLDNGIILRTKHEVKFPSELNMIECVDYGFADDNKTVAFYEYHLCYWRKCYSLRQDIIHDINMNSESYCKLLTIDDVKNIWHILNYYNKKKHWNRAESIWEWRDIKDSIRRHLLRLEWLIYFMKTHEDESDFAVLFYDSY